MCARRSRRSNGATHHDHGLDGRAAVSVVMLARPRQLQLQLAQLLLCAAGVVTVAAAAVDSCDAGTLPARLAVAEAACCTSAGCLLTGTSVCSVACAGVLIPLLHSCTAELAEAGAASVAEQLGPACEKAMIAADSGSAAAVGTRCEYADFVPVTMACASYLQLSPAALDADASFCYSACFEQAFAFHARCASQMSFAMRYALGAVETEVAKPAPKCLSGGGGYDGVDTLICEASGAAAVVGAACADASALLLPTEEAAAATGEDMRKAMCNSGCTTAIAGLSTACRHDPVFADAIDVAEACRDIHENSQCVDVADTFQKIAESECCGSAGVCAAGALPDTCSLECSMSVLPFLERCGGAVADPPAGGGGGPASKAAGAGLMTELAELCSPHRRR